MIERISELPWASFESQLSQKCEKYLFKDHRNLTSSDYTYWRTLTVADGDETGIPPFADETYSIQNQILYNAVALNDELSDTDKAQNGDRYTDKDIFFWYDLVQKNEDGDIKYPHEGYENTDAGRTQQSQDTLFTSNETFQDDRAGDETKVDEETDNLTQLPKTHAALSLVEVSEYLGPDNPESKYSNYVSRKVSMLWFFNVIKAIAKAIRIFPWMRIGVKEVERDCRHSEAESEPDTEFSPHGGHTFKRSSNPTKDGRLTVYGNAELNGVVTTFHSQARFHDAVTMWDTVKVYGDAWFAKDVDCTAMRVRWGDLAEYYEADLNYQPGTLVKFGGEKEITISDNEANAVVTNNPGFTLNEQLRHRVNRDSYAVAIALTGRVPVKVWGQCKKFDPLVPDPEHPGWAKVSYMPNQTPIARALQTKNDLDETVICATNFRI